MDVKTCFKCLKEKEISEFYKHKEMADGHVNKCKECNKLDVKESRSARLEYYREYDRKRANFPSRVEKRKQIVERWKNSPELRRKMGEQKKNWQEKNKIKRAAHVLTGNAIAGGRLIKLPCEVCGEEKSEAHHDDYERPLDVRWLCHKHHMEHHRLEREDARRK